MHSTQVIARMLRPASLRRLLPLLALPIAAAVGVAGCTKKTEAPPPTGPSTTGLSLELFASPDVLDIDGLSQSQITITARGPDGAPLSNVGVNLDIVAGSTIVDIGRLSTKSVNTGSDGRATVTYTSPAGAPQGNSDSFSTITIMGIPAGNDFSNAVARSVDIRLRPRGVILPEAFAPVPRFTFGPTPAIEDQDIRFDASSSIASCAPDPSDPNNAAKCTPGPGNIVSYLWDFGNGRTGNGVKSSTFYQATGTFTVKLTVTNDRGLTNSATQPITIGAATAPTADFTVSPVNVGVGERVNVDASASKATAERFLIEYNWTWGDGSTGSGILQNHRYNQAGTYAITLTVADSTGRTGTTTKSVTVGTGLLPTANFTFSPAAPTTGANVFFDATVSTTPPGRTVANYEWNFGDGSPILSGSNEARPSHRYNAPGTYTVTLTITDSNGAKSPAFTKTVTIL
jgi:PKD repeat protein